jgi:hypothetical protein
MPAVQRQGDSNSAGGAATGGVASVRVNGRPVVCHWHWCYCACAMGNPTPTACRCQYHRRQRHMSEQVAYQSTEPAMLTPAAMPGLVAVLM